MSSSDDVAASAKSNQTPTITFTPLHNRNDVFPVNQNTTIIHSPPIQTTPLPQEHGCSSTTNVTSSVIQASSSAITPPHHSSISRFLSPPIRNLHQNTNNNIFTPPIVQRTRTTLDEYFFHDINDSTFEYQSPIHPLPSISIAIPSPTVSSPNVSSIRATTTIDSQQQLINSKTRIKSIQSKKRKKVTVSPNDSMLGFLRINSIANQSSLMGFERINTSHHYKKVYNHWKNNKPCTYAPFKSLQQNLEASTFPLTSHHSRLLLEDFMMLQPGDTILCLISRKHYFLSNKATSTKWKSLLLDVLSIDSFCTIQFQQNRFFAFRLTVKSNVYYNDLKNYNMTADEIMNICTKSFGAGLTCTFSNGQMELIKFHHFLDHLDSIQFWKAGISSRIGTLARSLEKLKDISSLSPTFNQYLNEVYGDGTATVILLSKYDVMMKREDGKEQMKQYKSAQISSNQLKQNFKLNDDDEKFVQFRDFVDAIARDQVARIYGKFAEFTTPIFTQDILHSIICKFKTDLPRYYELIALILHKDVSQSFNKYVITSFQLPMSNVMLFFLY
jgi:hypothetical protein